MSNDYKLPLWFQIALPTFTVMFPISFWVAPVTSMTCLVGSFTLVSLHIRKEARKYERRRNAAYELNRIRQCLINTNAEALRFKRMRGL